MPGRVVNRMGATLSYGNTDAKDAKIITNAARTTDDPTPVTTTDGLIIELTRVTANSEELMVDWVRHIKRLGDLRGERMIHTQTLIAQVLLHDGRIFTLVAPQPAVATASQRHSDSFG